MLAPRSVAGRQGPAFEGAHGDGPEIQVARWHGIPGAQRHFLAGHGHFSLVFTHAASYLEPFRTAA